MNTQDYIALESRYGATNYKPLDVVLTRGQGIWVWDVDGNRYMDCLSAYSAVNQGHCHPKIAAVMKEQADKLTLTSRAFRNDQLGLFYQELCELTHSHMALPMNSGAEAVESCIKAVRKWGYKVKGMPDGQAEIIVCANNFHGRTITIVGFSTEEQYRDGYAPVHARLQDHPLRRCAGAGGGHHPQHGRLPGRADPGRGRHHRAARRLSRARCAASAPTTASPSSPTRSRPAWAAPASCWPRSTTASRPT